MLYLLANKVDLPHLRKVTPDAHAKFIRDHALTGGFEVSARTGESVLTAFFTAAAKYTGVDLTPTEIAATEKVVAVSVAAPAGGEEEARRAGADDIEREDMEAEARKSGGGSGGGASCCCVQ